MSNNKIKERLNSFHIIENSFEDNNNHTYTKKSLYKLYRFKEIKSEEKNNLTKLPEFGSPYFKQLLETDHITKILFEKRFSKKIENNFQNFNSLSNFDKINNLATITNTSNFSRIKPKGNIFEKKFDKNILSSFRLPHKFKEKYLKNF